MDLLLAARPKGLERPVHAVEFLEDQDGTLVTEGRTLCGRLAVAETDLDAARPQPFKAVLAGERCVTCDTFEVQGGPAPIPSFRAPVL